MIIGFGALMMLAAIVKPLTTTRNGAEIAATGAPVPSVSTRQMTVGSSMRKSSQRENGIKNETGKAGK